VIVDYDKETEYYECERQTDNGPITDSYSIHAVN
jgi:hypothetical protein